MAIARPNSPSPRMVLGHATQQFSPASPNLDAPDEQPKPCDEAAANFVGWARDVGVVTIGGSAVAGTLDTDGDSAAIRLEFRARQDFKAAFLECLNSGATVIEHPQQLANGDLSAKLRDPEGRLWDLTAPS